MPSSILSHLGELPVDTFIKDYWQQKPLLIRGAFPGFNSPLSADELAGLALEPEVESRLIIENDGKDSRGKGPWELRCGPFQEADFQSLPSSHWTLLVQAVDQWVPEVASLLREFYFLPSWRLDDVMISYAPSGGSVGPHYDQYDVFLIQAQGQREWRVGTCCDGNSPRLTNTDLHILSDFSASDSWVLNPGDMLYLPPQLSHWGIAKDNCMTYSVGFRAPSHSELAARYADDLISRLPESARFKDAITQSCGEHVGEITPEVLAEIRSTLTQYLSNDADIANWFGSLVSERKYSDQEIDPGESITESELLDALQEGCSLVRNGGSRVAFYQQGDGQQAQLFVDGDCYTCSEAFAVLLSRASELTLQDIEPHLNPSHVTLIIDLINAGAVYIE